MPVQNPTASVLLRNMAASATVCYCHMYIYNLVTDGREAGMKRMTLIK